MRCSIRILSVLFFWLSICSTFAQDDDNAHLTSKERILNYDVIVKIDTLGTLYITENIKVVSAGQQIKRGIFRTLPLNYSKENGTRQTLNYYIKSIKRNGKNEHYNTTRSAKQIEIRIGKSDVILNEGEHVYTIRYKIPEQIDFYDDIDELYLNIIGNSWQFDIDSASATIVLPKKATFLRQECYTGFKLEKGQNCDFEQKGHVLKVYATNLKKTQGLTIAAGFTKGIIVESSVTPVETGSAPTPYTNVPLMLLMLLLYFTLLYSFWALLAGKFYKQTIIPDFHIPENLSPAFCRYVFKGKIDVQSLTATVVQLIHKKLITVSKTGSSFSLIYLDAKWDDSLRLDEKYVYTNMFGPEYDPIELNNRPHKRMLRAFRRLENTIIKRNEEQRLYGITWPYIVLVIIAAIVFIPLLTFLVHDANSAIESIATSIPLFLINGVLGIFIYAWRYIACMLRGIAIFMLFMFNGFFLISLFIEDASFLLPLISVLLVVSTFIFIKHIRVLKSGGRTIRAKVLGLYRYIKVAENNRFEKLVEGENAIEMFEALFPYALAFGLENVWIRKFSAFFDEALDVSPVLIAASSSSSFSNSLQQSIYQSPTTIGSSSKSSSSSSSTSYSSNSRSSSSRSGSSGGGRSGGGGGGW